MGGNTSLPIISTKAIVDIQVAVCCLSILATFYKIINVSIQTNFHKVIYRFHYFNSEKKTYGKKIKSMTYLQEEWIYHTEILNRNKCKGSSNNYI